MPYVDRSNSRIMPANSRTADVAEKAIQEIIPVQQRRYYDSFRVQGIQCIHYSRLTSGRKCNCQSSAKQLNGLLDRSGKASTGTINQLLTGNLEFNVTPYNFDQKRLPGVTSAQTSPQAPANKNQGVFDIATASDDIPFADLIKGTHGMGDNGPVENTTIDELVGDWDPSIMGFSDVACPICFGTGFVSGFSPFHGHRQVLAVPDVQLLAGSDIDTLKRPFTAQTPGFNVVVILPAGAIGIDVFRVWNMANPVNNVQMSVDGTPLTSEAQLMQYCNGKPHLLRFTGPNGQPFEFTHLEIQFQLTTESVYFEFPKRSTSNNTDLLEQMEPFNIIVSPNLPTLESMDIIVEQQLGKILVVQNTNPWRSRQRNVLGWEAQVRVIQPMELFRILPMRGRVMNKDATTRMVRPNSTGPRVT